MWDVTTDRALIQRKRPELKFALGDYVKITSEHDFDCVIDNEGTIVAIDWSDNCCTYAVSNVVPILDAKDCHKLSEGQDSESLRVKYHVKTKLAIGWFSEDQLELAAVQIRVCILENVRPVVSADHPYRKSECRIDAQCGCGAKFGSLLAVAKHVGSSESAMLAHWSKVADSGTQRKFKEAYRRSLL